MKPSVIAMGWSLFGFAWAARTPYVHDLFEERVHKELFDLIDSYYPGFPGYIDFQPMDTVPAHVLPGEPAMIVNSSPALNIRPVTQFPIGSTKRAATGAPPSVDKTKLQFKIDGVTQYYTGINAWWLSAIADPKKVDQYMSNFQQAGLKIVRVWGFYDMGDSKGPDGTWFQDLSKGQINTDGSDGLKRLGQVFDSAEKYGIKVIVPFVNNWKDLGGIPAYMKAYGGDQKAWFDPNSKAQKQYQKYVAAVVSKFKARTCIFAWELSNEIECPACDDGTIVYNWAKTTAHNIKQIDSKHMVAIGDEGFAPSACPQGVSSDMCWPYDAKSKGTSFTMNLAIPDIDFGTYHMYPSSDWKFTKNIQDWSTKWIQAHAAACVKAGKPCLLEEYGSETDHVGQLTPWQKTASTTNGNAGDMIWQLGEPGSQRDLKTIDFGSSEWTSLVSSRTKSAGSAKTNQKSSKPGGSSGRSGRS